MQVVSEGCREAYVQRVARRTVRVCTGGRGRLGLDDLLLLRGLGGGLALLPLPEAVLVHDRRWSHVVEERRARCRVAAPVAGWVSAKVLAPHATDQVAAAVTVTTASTGVVPRPVDPEAFEDPAVVTAATLARDARERYEALGVEF